MIEVYHELHKDYDLLRFDNNFKFYFWCMLSLFKNRFWVVGPNDYSITLEGGVNIQMITILHNRRGDP